MARRAAADAKIVCVDNDPIVAMHATSFLPVTSEGAISFIAADARDPDTILTQAQRTLDFSQPVAIMVLGILQLIPEADDPQGIVGPARDSRRPGQLPGHLPSGPGHPGRGADDLAGRLSQRMPTGLVS